MARKKHTVAGAAVDLLFAPVSIAVSVGKAVSDAKKAADRERARQARLAQQEENRRLREEKRLAAEQARFEREQARLEKEAARKAREAAKLKARKEAEQARMKAAYASLGERYAYALERHQQLQELISGAADDMMRIEYCREDVALLPMLFDYVTRDAILKGVTPVYPVSDSCLILSEAYERTGDYPRAIQACQDAMELGMEKIGPCVMAMRCGRLREEMRKRGHSCGEV